MSTKQNVLKTSLSLSVLMLIALMFSASVFAFQLTPTVSVIDLPKDASGVTINLQNPRNVALPVEFEIVERFVNEDGSEEHVSADDQFLIFPPQALVNPGESQSVRVQWVDQAPEMSRSFTLFAKEIEVDLAEKEGPILQTLFRMGASIHVAPSPSKPDVSITDFSESSDGARLTLENSGNRFIYLNDVELRFDGKTYTGNELANIAGRTLLTPSGKRTIVIPNEKSRPGVSIAK